MSLAVFDNVSLSFGNKTIVEEMSLRIGAEDRIGLIGPNGSGKTSLMRILAGEQAPDGGQVSTRRALRLGYLPQDIAVEGGRSLLAFVRDSVPGRAELDTAVERCEVTLRTAEVDGLDEAAMMEVAEELANLHEQVTHYDMHFTEHEAMRILAGLGFKPEDYPRDLSEFSGGWKMRAVLSALLFQQPDLLLLDEPTNHLDMPSVAWFGDFLKDYKRAFILICHDREFLNEQIQRVVSFEPEGVRMYAGDYEHYLRQRAEEEIILENKAKNLAREREQAERFINRFRAQANKAKAVQSRVKALEKMEAVETFQKRKVMRFRFPATGRCANEPLIIKGLGKAYGDRRVLSDIDLTVRRGEKIGIIGVNGAGKTTLLRMLAGEIEATEGDVALGHNVKAGYFAQHHADTLHKDTTIFDTVAAEDEDGGVTRIRTILGAFLFSDDDVEKKVGVLSGGERARVALARLLVNPGNLLMMDEPTNHLDLASSEALAESLSTYDGTLVFVSHNRAFVRKLATRIWDVADGTVDTYPGTLDEYMDTYRTRAEDPNGASQPAKAAKAGPKRDDRDGGTSRALSEPGATAEAEAGAQRESPADAAPAPTPRKRGTRAEEKARKRREAEERARRAGSAPGGGGKSSHKKRPKRSGDPAKRIASLEADIAELEAAQQARSAQLADPEVYADAARSAELISAFEEDKAQIEALTQAWMDAQDELGTSGG